MGNRRVYEIARDRGLTTAELLERLERDGIHDKQALSTCIHDAVNPKAGSVEDAFEVTKRIAWALRGERAGLLRKDGGENIVG